MSEYFLKKILIFPVKSLGWIEPNQWEVQKRGFKFDRRWMLADEQGNFISQRRFPKLALLKTKFENQKLIVKNSLSGESLAVRLETKAGEIIEVKIFEDLTRGVRVSEEASEWFSEFLNSKVEFVFMPENFTRPVNPKYGKEGDVVSFADGFPYLLINTASVAELNKRLKNKIPAERFRPNLIVEGAKAFEEDNWQKIKIGEVVFRVVKPCSRCNVITVNQATGERDPEPLTALAEFRKVGNKVMFGQNLIAEREGVLKTGDKVEVLQ